MAKKSQRVVVGDTTYLMTGLDTTPSLALYYDLVRLVGPTVGKMIAAHGGDTDQQKKADGYLETLALEAFLRCSEQIPPTLMDRLSRTFAAETKVLTMAGAVEIEVELRDEFYEQHFSMRPKHWTAWLVACLKLNFADFLPSKGSAGSPGSMATPATSSP
jgi:hypothetical protein